MSRLLIVISFCFLGCSQISRVEYGRTDLFLPQPIGDSTQEYAVVEHGVRLEKDGFAADLMIGPVTQWSATESNTGVNINPRLFWFFDKGSFVHLETDFSLYRDQEVFFTFMAIEKVW